MSRSLQRLALVAHVASSVGWLGAVAVYLALGVLALASADESTVRGAYLVMEPLAWAVLAPLALASLVTGVTQSLLTPWGLLKHYWVVCKLVINVAATAFLLAYMATFRAMAETASDEGARLESVRNVSPVVHAALALVLLATATVLGVLKPRGRTRYGRREADQDVVVRPAG